MTTKPSLLIASNNKHKIAEIKTALGGYFGNITCLEEEDIFCDPVENGKTFFENAMIKARAAAEFTNKPVLADDTGLCVLALNGQPGVNSARYAGDHESAANRAKLLNELKNQKNRSAYFTTTVVLLYPDGHYLTAEGCVHGIITEQEHGYCGFGYDSLFFCPELNKTFAQASAEEKLAVSHRGRALQNLLKQLEND